MEDSLYRKILKLLDEHRLMSVATLRADGWPQTTTVGYVSDGLTLWFICDPNSQKAANLARDCRISLTIDRDTDEPMAITGLSMAAQARPVTDPVELDGVMQRLGDKFPEYKALPTPPAGSVQAYRVTPVVISVLDYSQEFGHSDLVIV